MSNILYIDCFSGVSGDMLLGAFLHLGMPEALLREAMHALGLTRCSLRVEDVHAGGIMGKKVSIALPTKNAHPTQKRNIDTIIGLIKSSGLGTVIKEKAIAVFHILAQAEAKIHGLPIEDIHFHEVGADDAIIDIVGTVTAIEFLCIDKILCSPLPMTRGWAHCDHGPLPIPAPAVCELLQNVPVYGIDIEAELVTPTGAALVKTLAAEFGPLPPMKLGKTGYGAGSRSLPDGRPNMLRLILGEDVPSVECQEIEVIETHLDDFSPELFPFVCEKLFSLGAIDVSITPMQMKKGRPAFLLRVLADPLHGFEIKKGILCETTAIGLRFRKEHRMTLSRQEVHIITKWGAMKVKEVETPLGKVYYPEYEECRRVAVEKNIPLTTVYKEINKYEPGASSKKM